jgi:hypothetical protein
MEMNQPVVDLFVTKDIDLTFNMIEDERGDVFWGYGHRDGPEFIEEVNRWLHHVSYNGASDPDDLFAASQPVEHLWARMVTDERFEMVRPADVDSVPQAFPVTKLVI